jgi:hypothetical protein
MAPIGYGVVCVVNPEEDDHRFADRWRLLDPVIALMVVRSELA